MQCSVCLDALKVNGSVDGMTIGTWKNVHIIDQTQVMSPFRSKLK